VFHECSPTNIYFDTKLKYIQYQNSQKEANVSSGIIINLCKNRRFIVKKTGKFCLYLHDFFDIIENVYLFPNQNYICMAPGFSSGKIAFAGLCLLLLSLSGSVAAQDGGIQIVLTVMQQADQAPIEGALVKVYSDKSLLMQDISTKKGKVKLELKYGPKYRIVLSKDGYVNSHFTFDGNVPGDKYEIRASFEQAAFLVDRREHELDTLRFRRPFTKWTYDINEKRFHEDLDYLQEFASGLFKEDEAAAKALSEQQAKDKAQKEAREKAEKVRRDALLSDFRKKIRIAGKLFTQGNQARPVMQARIALVNKQGNTVETTSTNALGTFVFSHVSSDENFVLEVEEIDPKYFSGGSNLVLTNKAGKQLLVLSPDAKGKYRFQILATDKNVIAELMVNDTELRIDIIGRLLRDDKEQNPMALLKINLRNEKGVFLQSGMTDKNGNFKFKNLPHDASYTVDINAADTKLKPGEKMLLVNNQGSLIQELSPNTKGNFKFEVLPFEQNKMTCLYAEDPWLKVIDPEMPAPTGDARFLIIKEPVYFNSNDATLLPEALAKLNEVINVMENVPGIRIELSSHTDSKGSDEYNMTLSEKRAKTAVDYIISRGIDPSRISGKGYGETQLVNKCGNGVECTEAEHAQNRRLEFKIVRN
jgi:outer membrane protein OmpA-like peptidoglycan-associated protein